ncbi:MAG: PepSY domain-containing protein [Pseudomonadales bacterium]|nr:PepSY domain-containing protein [Pseudomonadales bacterium]
MAWLHTWTGLVVGWMLFFMFVTGTAGYFHYEITRWMEPERPLVATQPAADRTELISLGLTRLEARAPQAAYWEIVLPHDSPATRLWQDFEIRWEDLPEPGHDHGARGNEILDPVTGAPLEKGAVRDTGGGELLYEMHYRLHYMDLLLAYYLVGICTLLMFIAIITGVITHKKIFKDFFTFRPGKGQRSWLDAHNVISVMALPFFIMITYSGLVFFDTTYMPAGMAAIYGSDRESRDRYFDDLYAENHDHQAASRPDAPLAPMLASADQAWGDHQVQSVFIQHETGKAPRVEIRRIDLDQLRWYDWEKKVFNANTGEAMASGPYGTPTSQTRQIITALHEGRFAGPWLRWLYFAAGLLGCAMIATGLVLWTVKRRKHQTLPGTDSINMRLIEALNVATIAGLPLGVAGYFWANRLLPVDIADRANWEANVLFLLWGEAFLYACFRDIRKAWVEILWLAAAAFALIPLLNLLTTDKHLGASLPAGEWVLAGFDLTMLGLGAAFAWMGIKVRRRWLAHENPGKPARTATSLEEPV